MASSTAVVVGGDGHLGNTLIRQLLRQGRSVRCLVLPGSANGALLGLGAEVAEGNLLDPPSLDRLFQGLPPDQVTVFHTAGLVSIASRPRQAVYDVNVRGTGNLLAACRRHGVRRIIYTSSVHAIPEALRGVVMTEPETLAPEQVVGQYAQTKAVATQMVLDSRGEGLSPVVVYPAGIIGPFDFGHGHLTQLIRDYLAGRLVACVGGGYNFVDVRDVAAGMVSAADTAPGGESFILSGHYADIPHLLALLHRLSGRPPVKTVLPRWFARATAPLSECYYALRRQPPLYTSYSLYTLWSNAAFSCEKAERVLHYRRRPLEETLRDTVDWLTAHDRV